MDRVELQDYIWDELFPYALEPNERRRIAEGLALSLWLNYDITETK